MISASSVAILIGIFIVLEKVSFNVFFLNLSFNFYLVSYSSWQPPYLFWSVNMYCIIWKCIWASTRSIYLYCMHKLVCILKCEYVLKSRIIKQSNISHRRIRTELCWTMTVRLDCVYRKLLYALTYSVIHLDMYYFPIVKLSSVNYL